MIKLIGSSQFFYSDVCTYSTCIYFFILYQTQDGDLYEKLGEYFSILGQLEVEASSSAKLGFEAVVTQANLVRES